MIATRFGIFQGEGGGGCCKAEITSLFTVTTQVMVYFYNSRGVGGGGGVAKLWRECPHDTWTIKAVATVC